MRLMDASIRLSKWMAAATAVIAIALATPPPVVAGEPTTSIQTEYLMTIHALLAPPLAVDQTLLIANLQRADGRMDRKSKENF